MTAATSNGAGTPGQPACAVRRFGAAEWPLYRALRLSALADAPAAFGSNYALEAARSDQDWAWRLHLASNVQRNCPLLAEFDGVPAGLAWAKLDDDDPRLARLFQMWVAPAARGHGLAALLLEAAVAWARERRAGAIELGVVAGNDGARRLYERAGFVPFGPAHPVRPDDPRLEQPMRLALDEQPR